MTERTDVAAEVAAESTHLMSLQDARKELVALQAEFTARLDEAAAAHKATRQRLHEWARNRRKMLKRYIAVLETREPPK